MKKYRIIKETTYSDERYYVQKRFLGFLWWYNVVVDYDDLGFSTLERAREVLQMLLYKTKKTVIDEV